MDVDMNTSAGFRSDGEEIRIQWPNCIRRSDDHPPLRFDAAAERDAATLFRVLRQYHLEDQRERSTVREVRGLLDPAIQTDGPALHWIECVLELLDDYREHGLLRYERRATCRADRGRIDWRTTIRREFACLSEDSSLYLRTFRRVVEAQENHPLTELHAETIRQLSKVFGAEVDLEVPGCAATTITPGIAMKTLARERNRIYRDHDHRVVKHMEQYWRVADMGRIKGCRSELLWTNQFEFIWQRMAERVIGGGHADNDGLPRGQYCEDGAMHRGLELRPDLVVDAECGTRIIFDAKYYTSGAMPSSGDVLKQLAYSYFSSNQWKPSLPERVVNIFLLPADSPRESVRLSGRHQIDANGQCKGRPLVDDIWLFRIDYRALAESYLAGASWDCGQFLDQIHRASGVNWE
jgi:hypothetical protein